MADIRSFPFLRHLRSEMSCHVLRFRSGALKNSGRGLAFWYRPLNTSVAEVPLDDRELHLMFHGRSRDHQATTVQGVITWRVVEPELLAKRIDFSVDLTTGKFLKEPLEQLASLITSMAQQLALRFVSERPIRETLAAGLEAIQRPIATGLESSERLTSMGVKIEAVRISDLRPTPELEKALQTPTREAIQQEADEATFQRRALAVEKERAIAENELKNRIELARRESDLLDQQGANTLAVAVSKAQADKVAVEARADRMGISSVAEAGQIRLLGKAKADTEAAQMAVYEKTPPRVLMGLAAREFAGKLEKIEHLNISPEMLGPIMDRLVRAGTTRLEQGA
jgi:regulator of protease activity HflC (stomatin/prohibitin superfamily)